MITGNQLRAARAILKLSQKEFAENAGVGLSTVKGLEDDKLENPGFKTVGKIEAFLEEAGIELMSGGARLKPADPQ